MPFFRQCLIALFVATLVGACTKSVQPVTWDYPVTRLTQNVYVIHGPRGLPDKSNRGFMNNPGFVLTGRGVVIVDPGSSNEIGKMVLKKIRAVTDKPVIAVFNTHIHGDHWLGNSAIKKAFPKATIYGHPNMKSLADSGEGDNWVALLNKLTDGAIAGTVPVPPDVAIDNQKILLLGGMRFRVHHHGKAHTDGDIIIEVVDEGVTFLGDTALNKRIGRMIDGNFKGNVSTLNAALKLKSKFYVPGHGPSGGAEIAIAYRDYLKNLHDTVALLYEQGIPDYEMKPTVRKRVAAFKNWLDFETELGKHVSYSYLQVEQEAF